MLSATAGIRRQAAQRLAVPMFVLSLVFLAVIAVVLVMWVDVPLFFSVFSRDGGEHAEIAPAGQVVAWVSPETAYKVGSVGLWILLLAWPLFPLELLLQYVIRDRTQPFWRQRLVALIHCLCPPLRMCAPNYDLQGRIWFPRLGWQEVDRALRERLEKLFSIPMIFIALTILPVLLIELGMQQQVLTRPWLQFLLHASMGLIWFAFATEFIVMVSVADKKLKYCKEHWLDLAIILLPFIAFLRSLRVIRATRLAKLAKVQQLSRMGRLYRLRGLAMRAFRALLILELLNRLLPISPQRRLKRLRELLADMESDVKYLRQQIATLEWEVQQQGQGEAESDMATGGGGSR